GSGNGVPEPDCVTVPLRLPIPTPNVTELLATDSTVTTTGPVVAPAGTLTLMLESLQAAGVAVTPLNVTELDPCAAPKLDPLTVTTVPTGPADGVSVVMEGFASES